MHSFDGKVAAITGAASGLGRAPGARGRAAQRAPLAVGRDARLADLLVRLLGPAYQALVVGRARQARRRAQQRRQLQA